MATSVFAIGDIHGRLDLLEPLLADVFTSPYYRRGSQIVFLGDYIDRGPAAGGVIERLAGLPAQGVNAVFLTGNHELALLDFLERPEEETFWLQWGGVETAASYGVQAGGPIHSLAFRRAVRDQLVKSIPARHVAFLRSLRLHHLALDTLFVHAGIRPGIPLERQSVEDLTFIRGEFLNDRRPHPWYIVHGHTPVLEPDIRDNRANIDTGAFATGVLTCLVVTEKGRFLLERPALDKRPGQFH